jgi:hypothetical protein
VRASSTALSDFTLLALRASGRDPMGFQSSGAEKSSKARASFLPISPHTLSLSISIELQLQLRIFGTSPLSAQSTHTSLRTLALPAATRSQTSLPLSFHSLSLLRLLKLNSCLLLYFIYASQRNSRHSENMFARSSACGTLRAQQGYARARRGASNVPLVGVRVRGLDESVCPRLLKYK